MVGSSNVLGTLIPKPVHLLLAVFSSVPPGREEGVNVQIRCDTSITVEDRG